MPAVEAPVAITFLGGEKDPAVADPVAAFTASERAKVYNLRQVTAHPTGGHFGHFEEPEAVVQAIRAMFGS
jgi:pimeloyl-ACP methyl ester carboxylesterase